MAFSKPPSLPEGATWAPIVRVRYEAGSLSFVALSDWWSGIWTHWNGCSTYCRGPDGCDCGQRPCRHYWKGYLPAMRLATRQLIIAEFTPTGVTELELWKVQRGQLRGALVTQRRAANYGNAPVIVRVEEVNGDRSRLPEEFDPTWSVLHVLGEPRAEIERRMREGDTDWGRPSRGRMRSAEI